MLRAKTERHQTVIDGILSSNPRLRFAYERGVIIDGMITYDDMAAIVDFLRGEMLK